MSMWRARLTKAVFLLFAGYLGFHCYMASLWLPLVLCVIFVVCFIALYKYLGKEEAEGREIN